MGKPRQANIIPIWLAAVLAVLVPTISFALAQIRVHSLYDLHVAFWANISSIVLASVFQIFNKILIVRPLLPFPTPSPLAWLPLPLPLPLPSPFSTDTKPSIGRPPTPLLRRLPAARRPPPRRRRRLPRPLFHMGNLLWPEPRLHPGRPKVLALRAHHRRLRRLHHPQPVPQRQAEDLFG